MLAECQRELSTVKPQYKEVMERMKDYEERINSERYKSEEA